MTVCLVWIDRMKRLYIDSELSLNHAAVLSEAAYHYLFRVNRIAPEATIVAFNGDGYDYTCQLQLTGKRHAQITPVRVEKNTRESPLHTVLIQGISKGERMDYVMQKAVELGVNEIYPVLTARAVVKLDQTRLAKKNQHWHGVAIGACEQSGRAVLPEIHPVMPLQTVLAALATPPITAPPTTALTAQSSAEQSSAEQAPLSDCIKLVLHPTANEAVLSSLAEGAAKTCCILIGPEGGLTDAEVSMASASGFVACQLGHRILRTETAAVSALTAAQILWGDFRVF
ncbi:16S rRNA (uracil(1498)-N(3))-methyltransferase [Ostreibacterium oceani]|uniref:Ribosomal RNA small subunit methyltransferase E n=1 Tax=Ostreibacterium oceani TaxID=2654998 RepID=A0A6N7F2Z9_9GAMM|nr:16S rRNA (uracil(1498)-N(3))-methyltransferase [Ostreibacterium oceani]MPV86236.1 16S rRNA (uracil(1498)-N(3))-methyltransferase [Ostreibacterium oceani]